MMSYETVRGRLERPRRTVIDNVCEFLMPHGAPDDGDAGGRGDGAWAQPATLEDARPMLARLPDGLREFAFAVAMDGAMKRCGTGAAIYAAVGNDPLQRTLDMLGQVHAECRTTLGRDDFLDWWWPLWRCRLAVATVDDTVEWGRPVHRQKPAAEDDEHQCKVREHASAPRPARRSDDPCDAAIVLGSGRPIARARLRAD